jgi:hypothetical protein
MLGLEALTASQALDLVRTIAMADPGDPDAIVFQASDFSVLPINIAEEEQGHQISGVARIGSMQVPLKIEISHGHVVSPAPTDEVSDCAGGVRGAGDPLLHAGDHAGGEVRGHRVARHRACSLSCSPLPASLAGGAGARPDHSISGHPCLQMLDLGPIA